MTPVSIPQPQLTQERRSAALTILLLLVALLLGWGGENGRTKRHPPHRAIRLYR
jgi:hypothetical protein